MFQLRPLGYIQRSTARLRFWIIRRSFSAGTIAAAATGLVAALGSYYFGFRPAGIKAGSPAASWQSRIGCVKRGSNFSILQSAGAGGSGALVVYGLPAAGVALITVVLGYRMRNRTSIRRLKLKHYADIEQQRCLRK
ncbi:hypothetical protein SVAN01_00294 [Stagonosporopsis vannaccii]|nr:hypothetical protein SVAN01_00294 [Stagonosporopsis vannaccii]